MMRCSKLQIIQLADILMSNAANVLHLCRASAYCCSYTRAVNVSQGVFVLFSSGAVSPLDETGADCVPGADWKRCATGCNGHPGGFALSTTQ